MCRSSSSRVHTWKRQPSSHSCAVLHGHWRCTCPSLCNDRCRIFDDVAPFIDGFRRPCDHAKFTTKGPVHRHRARVDPTHQGEEGVAGTPGACSQAFCHPNLVHACAVISTKTCPFLTGQNHNHHNHHNHHTSHFLQALQCFG